MSLVRKLSFSRRRPVVSDAGKGTPPSRPIAVVARATANTPTEPNDSDDDSLSNEAEVQHKQLPLSGTLAKQHRSKWHVNEWARRCYDTDERFHALYSFQSRLDQERRLPKHIFPLGDLIAVEPLDTPAGPGFRARFATPHIEKRPASRAAPPDSLVCACESRSEQRLWLRGLHQRMARQACEVMAHRLVIDKEQAQGLPYSAPADPFSDDRGSTPSADAMTGGKLVGVTMCNIEGGAIGAFVQKVRSGSPAADAGLRPGDVILAVNNDACLSHVHCCRLLSESYSPIEVVVWQPDQHQHAAASSPYQHQHAAASSPSSAGSSDASSAGHDTAHDEASDEETADLS